MTTHHYAATTRWRGSLAAGYEAYDRTHDVQLDEESLNLSADPAFRGDARLPNPEQLVLAAASSCQLLSFLAVAARARVDVVGYTDEAEAQMSEDDAPVRLTDITLRPRITVRGDIDRAKVDRLVRLAHEQCYIANSLSSRIHIEHEVVTQ